MKKNITNLIFIILLLVITFEVLKESTIVLESVRFSFKIWQNNIFPSLFPFFIIGNILISLGLPEILGELLKNVMYKLFKINSNASFIIIISMISGFPSSAKYIKDLLDRGIIDEYDGTKILTFTHFSNPLFVIGTVSTFIGNKNLGIPILISHYFGNLIIGLLLRNYNKKEKDSNKISFKNINLKKEKIGTIITNSIKDSINTLLLILGTVTVFLVLTTIINNIFNINGLLKPIINGLFEMTQGLKYLEELRISSNLKGLIAVIILSFGGLSVHMQTLTIISDTKIKYFPYFISRIFHAIISALIFLIWKVL